MRVLTANTIVIAQQDPNVTARQEIQRAAREIRTQVQREVQRELQAEGRGGEQIPPPTPPPVPHVPAMPGRPGIFVSPMDGQEHVYVGGSQFPFRPRNEQIPPEAVDMAMGFFFTVVAIIIGLPIARAFARRMDRKAVAPQVPAEVTQQLNHLAQAVDAIALEVERISEGQRYTTRLLSEQRETAHHALPTGSDR